MPVITFGSSLAMDDYSKKQLELAFLVSVLELPAGLFLPLATDGSHETFRSCRSFHEPRFPAALRGLALTAARCGLRLRPTPTLRRAASASASCLCEQLLRRRGLLRVSREATRRHDQRASRFRHASPLFVMPRGLSCNESGAAAEFVFVTDGRNTRR